MIFSVGVNAPVRIEAGLEAVLSMGAVTQPRKVQPSGAPAAGRVMELLELQLMGSIAATPAGTEKLTR